MQRREFLIRTGQGLALGGWLQLGTAAEPAAASGRWAVHAMLDLDSGSRATVRVAKSEMGQGVLTALPMLICEELDLPLEAVDAELAPGALAFRDERGNQTTGYSSSVSSSFLPLRLLGATARHMLLQAAAMRWSQPLESLTTESGYVRSPLTGQRLAYGELIDSARSLPVPTDVALRARAQWRLLGRGRARLDTPPKVDGSAQYGIDVSRPGMLVGVVARAPVAGMKPVRLDARRALRIRGVVRILTVTSGIAVLARNFHAAQKARDALSVTWPGMPAGGNDTAEQHQRLVAALAVPGVSARTPAGATPVRPDDRALEASYSTPFLAHAALEPLACTAEVRPERCDIWVGTQAPSRAQNWGAEITGLPLTQVFVHTQLIGGAFGRRGEWDFVIDAVEAAKQSRMPVKIIWTRADDMRHDFYRPMTANKLHGRVSADGQWLSYRHRLAAPSVARRRSPDMLKSGTDFLMTQGSSDLHYDVDDVAMDYREVDLGVPVGFWRSVGHSHNGFVAESFVDELAALAGRDPLEFRLAHLQKEPRMRAVLEKAAAAAGWHQPRQPGTALGIACMKAYGTYVAEVAAVRLLEGRPSVSAVWCAVDCGVTVNPLIVRQQMESGIIFGLSAALDGEITHAGGRVVQSNFHDYAPLRIDQSPRISVDIVDSGESPGGCGEPATPVIAPAVANAIYALTGQRLRSLPLRLA
jgi:isoquinoline 1-oxidoreductase beta subunit